MKFGQYLKFELKMFFRMLPPNFVKGPYESWLKFCPFCMDELSEMKQRINLCSK